MGNFDYEALTASGRRLRGTMEADNREQALTQLAQMQLSVHRLEQATPAPSRSAAGRGELLLFNQQLASVATAGMPLERSLRELAADAASPRMRKLIEEVAADLEGGLPLAEAFSKRARYFPPMYGRIVQAGVASGRLGEMLTSLNRHSEVAARTRHIVLEATTYPVIVLALASLLLTGLLVYTVPHFAAMFEGFGHTVPTATQYLIDVSNHIGTIWLCIGVGAAALVATLVAAGRSPAGRRFREALLLHLPILGRLWRDGVLSRLCDAMSLQAAGGVELPAALRLSGGACGSELAGADCDALAAHVCAGGDLLAANRPRCRLLTGLVLYSAAVSCRRDELHDNMASLSEMYAAHARAHQGRLQAFLLPLLLIVVGVVIGAAITSLFLPVISLLRAMQGAF